MAYKKIQNNIDTIFRYYKRAKIALLKTTFNSQFSFVVVFGQEEYNASDFVTLVEKTILMLNKEYQKIIETNFLSDEEKTWWMEYYSRTTYYRFSKNAYLEFLSYINSNEANILSLNFYQNKIIN